MKRLFFFVALAAMIILVPAVRADDPADLLILVDLKGTSLNDLMTEIDVVGDMGGAAVAKGNAKDLENLIGLGLACEVVDTNPEAKEYFLVFAKAGENLAGIAALGDILALQENVALVRTGQESALLIAGLGLEIAKVFMDPMVPVVASDLLSKGVKIYHAEIQDMVDAVDQSNLETLADDLVDAGGYGTRRSSTDGGFWAAQYIYDTFVSYGITDVSFHEFNINAPNVVATIPGTVFPENIFVLGGHYDSLAMLSATAPGADDNASGTVGVMEAARILSGYSFENTVTFIAFASEESGLIGSNAYARDASQRGDNILGMLNVDMIGYLASGDTPDVDIIAGSGSSGLRELAFWATEQYVPGFPAIVGSGMIGGSSDHASFTSHGYPAIWFFEDVAQDSPYIHSTNDIVGLSLNSFELARDCTKSIVATLASLAEPLDDIAIGHTPLDDTDDTVNPYPVLAQIISTEPLAAGFPVLYYSINGGAFTDQTMNATANPDEYLAEIPAQPLDTTVDYYLEVEDILGGSDTSPAAAPDKTYSFEIAQQATGWLAAQMESSHLGSDTVPRPVMLNAVAVFLFPAAAILFWKIRRRIPRST